MRKQLLGLFVMLLAFVLIAAAADITGKGVAKETTAALQRLEVTHSQDGLRVEFKATGKSTPKVTTLDSPARIVVDFPNTVMGTAQSRISVGRDGVKDVRAAMDGQVPPNTRVVIDLDPAGGGRKIGGRERSAKTGAGFGSGSFGCETGGCSHSGGGRERPETGGLCF